MIQSIHTICVCGAGTMGTGIAQVAAQAGYGTILYELNPGTLTKARQALDTNLERMVQKNRISAGEKVEILQRIRFTAGLEECVAQLVIEAVVEKTEVKTSLFGRLHELNGPGCIFASNTSSLSVSAIADEVQYPERVIGMHFFNPAPVMKLVEVVRGSKTSEEVTSIIVALARKMGKVPVVCNDAPGFIVNRVARPYYIESLRLLESGLGDPAGIDALLEATGFKMGPFKLMDLIGNDINYAVSCSLFEQLGRPERLRPSPVQEEKVKQGRLGRKTGEGYFRY